MADEKEASTSIPLSQGGGEDPEDPVKSPPNSPASSTRKACYVVLQSWVSKKFMTGCVVLFPVAITFFITWWFIQFVDGFFRPIYNRLGINIFGSSLAGQFQLRSSFASGLNLRRDSVVAWLYPKFISVTRLPPLLPLDSPLLLQFCHCFFCFLSIDSPFPKPGLGFVTSLVFVFLVGVFVSSWMGATVFWIGEWFIKRMPFVKHLYSASKQISSAISPDQNTTAFKEVAIIRHPRAGEYAFGFITSSVVLQNTTGDEELCSVYVPTNHLYIGDIVLVNSEEIIRPNLSIREGIEIIVSGGMTMPQLIAPHERLPLRNDRVRLNRMIQH